MPASLDPGPERSADQHLHREHLSRQGMVRHLVKQYSRPSFRSAMRTARQGIALPASSRRRQHPSEAIWAIAMVKNEADVIELTVFHLLDQGVDRILVVDNLSDDGTLEILRSMGATDARVIVGVDSEPGYYQAAKMTHLARYARRNGASWVIPFDADELWFAQEGRICDALRDSPASVATAAMHNAFPTEQPGEFRVETRPHDHPKVAYRPHPFALPMIGNHDVARSGLRMDALRVLHLPWRSEAQLLRKIRQGAKAFSMIDAPSEHGWHWRDNAGHDSLTMERLWGEVVTGTNNESIGWSPRGPFLIDDPRTWTTWPERLP